MTHAEEEEHGDRIVKTVDLDASPTRVWKALTDYQEFGAWFRVDLDQPFQVGERSTGKMTYPGHEGVPWLAFVERMDYERLFSFRWYDTLETSTETLENQPALLVEFQIEEASGGTLLTITESGFLALPDSRRIELMRGNEDGWNLQAKNIAQHLAT